MSKQITFKRNHVEIVGCATLLIAFIVVCILAYMVFIYTPEIKNEPFEYPKEETK